MLGIDLEFIEDESTLISHPIFFLVSHKNVFFFYKFKQPKLISKQ